jgi:hypothetical protein
LLPQKRSKLKGPFQVKKKNPFPKEGSTVIKVAFFKPAADGFSLPSPAHQGLVFFVKFLIKNYIYHRRLLAAKGQRQLFKRT